MDEEIVEGTDVWEPALPGEPGDEEQYADGICALCGAAIQIPLGPYVFRGQCECGAHFWISNPDGDDFDTICGLIEENLREERVFVFQRDPVNQYLAVLHGCGHYHKIRNERFDQFEQIEAWNSHNEKSKPEQPIPVPDGMLGYICFIKLDPPPTMEMFH